MRLIIKRPVVSEKYLDLAEKRNQYGFIVDPKATKDEIKAAVEKLYEVKVINVNTMRYAGDKKTRFKRTHFESGRTPAYKKAVITLAEGDMIDFFENV